MNEEPSFLKFEVDKNSGNKYPVLQLLGVKVHCNHAKTVDDALEDWNRRKGKINYENLFFSMITNNVNNAKSFLTATQKYAMKRICFLDKNNFVEPNDGIYYFDLTEEKSALWEIANKCGGPEEYRFNLIKLLLGGNDYERVTKI